ncbi:hypothetical protein CBR_g74686 [Chara braunii]|uniref:Uncharacterized protein n=1 Tax=Chara braunii TaxID=69332 RepID=A0A388KAC8_CHABU|nr:hypothetical protein CBR_g74686 [Chara braunii]|eukprot:GBG67000.1 hypothetical protein CBR_g74686 [Chara braunii]
MVQNQMRSVCEELLGKKVECSVTATTTEVRRRTEADAKTNQEGELLGKKEEEIVRLKEAMAEMQRQSCRPQQSEQELASLRMDNQHLIQDVIRLKEQVNDLIKATRTTSGAMAVSSPSPSLAKTVDPTSEKYVKLADAYRRVRDDKDMAEREVQARKERIARIGSAVATPPSTKKKRILRKSVSPPANLRIRLSKMSSPMKNGEASKKGQLNVQFIKLKNEGRDEFRKRVFTELSKLKKKEIEQLCEEEKVDYVTIKASATEIADAYADRAFGKRNVPPPSDTIETKEDSGDSKDLAGGSGFDDGDEGDASTEC